MRRALQLTVAGSLAGVCSSFAASFVARAEPRVPPPPRGTAIVTGGSRGIGAATARELGRSGYGVVVAYRSDDNAADGVVKEIVAAGGRAVAVQCDVSKEADVKRLFTCADGTFGAAPLKARAPRARPRLQRTRIPREENRVAHNRCLSITRASSARAARSPRSATLLISHLSWTRTCSVRSVGPCPARGATLSARCASQARCSAAASPRSACRLSTAATAARSCRREPRCYTWRGELLGEF